MKALLVYNPAAGRFPVKPFVYNAARLLRDFGWQVQVAATRSGEHAVELGKNAAGAKLDAVFVAGGDGTIGQVASGVAGSGTALGILPSGTQNVMAGELGLPVFGWNRWWALAENIRTLAEAPVRSVDVGLCNDKPFLLWSGLGLDALAVNNLEPRPRLEKYLSVPQYAAVTIWTAAFWHGMDLSVQADGHRIQGHYLLAIVTNIRTYMGGLAQLSPQARLDDGQMDLWLFSGSNLGDALRHAFDMMAGRHHTAEGTLCIPFHELEMEADTATSLELDGEPRGKVHRVRCSVLSRSLRLMMPTPALSLLNDGRPDTKLVTA